MGGEERADGRRPFAEVADARGHAPDGEAVDQGERGLHRDQETEAPGRRAVLDPAERDEEVDGREPGEGGRDGVGVDHERVRGEVPELPARLEDPKRSKSANIGVVRARRPPVPERGQPEQERVDDREEECRSHPEVISPRQDCGTGDR